MRFLISLTLVVLSISNFSSAQDKIFGIKGGFSISNLLGDGIERINNNLEAASTELEEKNLYWFSVGFFATKEILPDLFSFQSEFFYVRNGKQWDVTVDGATKTIKSSVDYIQFPWLIKLSLPIPYRPHVYAGPSLSIMFRSRIENIPGTINTDVPFFTQAQAGSEVFEYATNVIDIGLTTGIDVTFPLGPGFGILDFRFNLGGLNVYNYPQADNIRSYNFMMMAGYGFNFGGGY